MLEPSETGGGRTLLQPSATGNLKEGGRGCTKSDLVSSCSQSPAESSSIGKNSDEESKEEEDNEVQSVLKGGFEASMDSLEEALPMRRGISTFYNGKSKSFASLTEAASQPSVEAIVKTETPYTRKRRNKLAHTLLCENPHYNKTAKSSHLIRGHGGRISKKPSLFASSSSSRNSLAFASSRAAAGDKCSSPLSLTSICHWRRSF